MAHLVDVIRLHLNRRAALGPLRRAPITVFDRDRIDTACLHLRHPEHQAKAAGGAGHTQGKGPGSGAQNVSAIRGSAQGRGSAHGQAA